MAARKQRTIHMQINVTCDGSSSNDERRKVVGNFTGKHLICSLHAVVLAAISLLLPQIRLLSVIDRSRP
eukprot:5486697-Amphidinium_carterae.2